MTATALKGSLAVPGGATSRPGRPKPVGETRLLHVVPAQHGAAAPGSVVRVDLGPSHWALVSQPAGLQVKLPPPDRAGPFICPLPGRLALVRVPRLADLRLATSVLIYRRGQTLIYCPQADITDRAACVLSALTGQVLDMVITGGGEAGLHMTVDRIDHSQLPADHRHVASVEVRAGGDIVFSVCSGLISARLAEALGLLCTAHARDLLQLARHRPQPPAEDHLAEEIGSLP